MKKIALINLFIIVALAVSAQCNQPYKAFNQFANDTTAFLRYNFKTRADCYKGKTMAQVLTDLQLRPRSYTPLSSTYVGKYRGIRIHIDSSTRNERIQNPKRKVQCIYIYWDKLLDYEELLQLGRKYKTGTWLQEHYDLLKNNIVGEVSTK